MKWLLLILVCGLCCCGEKQGEPVPERVEEDGSDAGYRYKGKLLYEFGASAQAIAYDDVQVGEDLKRERYTAALSALYLEGVLSDVPLNFVLENKDVDHETWYHAADPLGWQKSLDGGAEIHFNDLGNLMILQKKEKWKGRDQYLVLDCVSYAEEMESKVKSKSYSELGALIAEAATRVEAETTKQLSEAMKNEDERSK